MKKSIDKTTKSVSDLATKKYDKAKELAQKTSKMAVDTSERIRDKASDIKNASLRNKRKKEEIKKIDKSKIREMLGGKKTDALNKPTTFTQYKDDPKLSARENARKEKAYYAEQELDHKLNQEREKAKKQVEAFNEAVSTSAPVQAYKGAKKLAEKVKKDGKEFANKQLQKGKDISDKVGKQIKDKAIDPAKKSLDKTTKSVSDFATKHYNRGKDASNKLAEKIRSKAIDPASKFANKQYAKGKKLADKTSQIAIETSENIRDKASDVKNAVLRSKHKTSELAKIDKAKLAEMLGGKETDTFNKRTTFTQYVDDPKLSARENARKEKAYYAEQVLDDTLNKERAKAKKQVEEFHEAVSTSAPAKLYRGTKDLASKVKKGVEERVENLRDKASDIKHASLRKKRKKEEIKKIDNAKIREMLGGKKTDTLHKSTTFTQYVDDPKLSKRENARKEKAYYAEQVLDDALNKERAKAKKQVEAFHEAVSTSAPGKLYKGAKKLANNIKEDVKDTASIAKHKTLNKMREKTENIKTDAKEFIDMVGGEGFSDKLEKEAKDNFDDFRKTFNEALTETKNIIADYQEPISKEEKLKRKKKDKKDQEDYEEELKKDRERAEKKANEEKERILEAAREKQRLINLARELQAKEDAKKAKKDEEEK